MAQTLTRILLHIVFSTKDRRELITPTIEPELYAYIGGIGRNLGSPLISAGGMPDHVHLLMSMSKNIRPADLVMHVKKDSSKWIKTKGEEFLRFGWQDGYSLFSIGESGVEGLERYFAGQKTHHQKRTFKDELRGLLRRYKVPFDERYIWD